MPSDARGNVVDWIMGRILEDVIKEAQFAGKSDQNVDNLVLHLSCGHMITVESADGIAGLSSFYETDSSGKWTRPQAPAIDTSLLLCPSCRSPFNFRRYGRIVKKADLDLSERSLAITSSRTLRQTQERLVNLQIATDVSTLKECDLHSSKSIDAKAIEVPLPSFYFDLDSLPHQMSQVFGFNTRQRKLWESTTGAARVVSKILGNLLTQPSHHQEV